MIYIILSGCNGFMGKVLTAIADNDPDIKIIAGIDIITHKNADYPVYACFTDIPDIAGENGINADVVIDFSKPAALDDLLTYGKSKNIPLILCATGYSPEQIAAMESTSEHIPLFRSGNMSLGINLLADLIGRACSVLGDKFDVEIIERHHNRKVDAPSGTALMLADAANAALPYDAEYVYDRQSKRQPRSGNEIGISAVRGGTIVGMHEVIFAGLDETIEIRHTAASRDVFAVGAVKAAKYIIGRKPGMYDMRDVLR